MPNSALIAEVEAFYPKGEGRDRSSIGLERMLRMYIAQQGFNLTNACIENAVYNDQATQGFVDIDQDRKGAPDATTVLEFRRLLEEHNLNEDVFGAINADLADKGLSLNFPSSKAQWQISSLPPPDRPKVRAKGEIPRCIRSRNATLGTSI